MFTISRSLALFAVMVATACSREQSERSDPSTDRLEGLATPGELAAEIRVTSHRETIGRCTVEWKALEVSLPNGAAAARINDALAVDSRLLLLGTDCNTTTFTASHHPKVTFNERGVLSVQLHYSWYEEGAGQPDPALGTRTFDLRDGRTLELFDVVDDEGTTELAQACERFLGEASLDIDVARTCRRAAEVDPDIGPPRYGIDGSGLRIHPPLPPHIGFALTAEGALAPWSTLTGHLLHESLATLSR
jgi:hypothetical protein